MKTSNKTKYFTWVIPLVLGTAFAEEPHALKNTTIYSSTIHDRFDSHLENPSSSTYISGKDIDDQHAKNIQEVLRGIPGITSDLYGYGDEIKIKIRGIDSQRYHGENPGVAIVIDGVPIFERTGKVNIDLDNIESIRVIKGGASYLYGADALAGAVIITTKNPQQGTSVAAEYEAGSFGFKKHLASANFSAAALSGRFQYSKRETDGYHFLTERDSETHSLNLNLAINPDSDLKLIYEKTDKYRDGSGAITGVTQAKMDPKGKQATRGYTRNTDTDITRFNLTYSNNFSDTGNLSLIGYQFKDQTSYWQAPARFDGFGKPIADSNYSAYTSEIDYEQKQRGTKLELSESFSNLALLGGLDFREDRFEDLAVAKQDYKNSPSPFSPVIRQGTTLRKGERTERTRAAYTELKLGMTDFTTFTSNYRYDNLTLNDKDLLTGDKRKKQFNISSWRLGLDHSLTDNTSIYGGISTGFRAPTLVELSTNKSLSPEHTRNYEIGMRSNLQLLSWDTSINGSLFHLRRKDFITSYVGQNVGDNAVDNNFYDNIGDVVSQGLELALSTDIQHSLSFDMAYTYLDSFYKKYDNFYLAHGNSRGTKVNSMAELTNPNSQVFFRHFDNKNKQVPRTPKHTLNMRTHWHFHNSMYLTLESDYKSSSYADEINQEKIKSRNIFNLTWNYKQNQPMFGSKKNQIGAFVKVENLTNKTYYSAVRGVADSADIHGNYDGIYNAEDLSITVDPGRTWSAGMSLRF